MKPPVEVRGVAARGTGEVMVLAEPLQTQLPQRPHLGERWVVPEQLDQLGTGLSRLSSSAMKRSNASFERMRSWFCLMTSAGPRGDGVEQERGDRRVLEVGRVAD